MEFKKGDVIFGRKGSDAYHPILFLEEKDENFFYGIMLTKAGNYDTNIMLPEKYIVKENKDGLAFPFQYNNTHFVKAKLLKKNEWEPFTKIGKISVEGIEFVESNIVVDQAQLWEEFLKK
jgi:hypothetical protein